MTQEQDSDFVRTFTLVIVVLTAFGIAMIFLSRYLAANYGTGPDDATVAERIAPVGKVNTGEPVVPEAPAEPAAEPESAAIAAAGDPQDPGQQVYDQACAMCHAQGVAGAPRLGSAGEWQTRFDKGLETLVDHAINGFQGEAGMMPARGGRADLSDEQVRAAVRYMISASGGDGLLEADGEPTGAGDGAGEPDADPADPQTDAGGRQVYDNACSICHGTGAAGAPKLGDAGAWQARTGQGTATLYDHAINGYMGEQGLMPPKGGRADLSDEQVRAAVDYMLDALP